MRRKLDPMFRKPTKQHLEWLRAVDASMAGGKSAPLDDFGVTFKRVEILCDMGLVHFYKGFYKPTDKGKQYL